MRRRCRGGGWPGGRRPTDRVERGVDWIIYVGGGADPARAVVLDCRATLGARRSNDMNPGKDGQLDQRRPDTACRSEY